MKLCLTAAVMLLGVTLWAEDWPRWRGPWQDGVSSEKVGAAWPAAGPKLLWHASVGTGFSSVSVCNGRAYTMGNTNNQDTIWCFDAVTGKPLWHHTYPAPLGPQWYEGGPGATPTVGDGQVFTISKWGDVFCLNATNGSVVWQRDLREEGIKPNRWGFAGSPLLLAVVKGTEPDQIRDLVILNAGTAGTALNRRTGRTVWCNGTNATAYASPMVFNSGQNACVLIFAAKHLVAVDPKDGRELWRQFWETGWDTNNSDPLIHAGRIFLSSYSRGCGLFAVESGAPRMIYTNANLCNHLSPGVVKGDYVYAFSGEAKTDTDLRCLHLPSGAVKWTRKDPAFGSLILVGDKLLVLSDKGELLLAEASPEEFKPLARAKVLTGLCWTPPTLANGRVYVRNAKGELRCFELGAL